MTASTWDKVQKFLNENPRADTSDLYKEFNAPEEVQKSTLRNYRWKWKEQLKQKNENRHQFEKLTAENIEKVICDLLNEQVTESRVNLAVKFYDRIKNKGDDNFGDLNLEMFLENGE